MLVVWLRGSLCLAHTMERVKRRKKGRLEEGGGCERSGMSYLAVVFDVERDRALEAVVHPY